MIRLRASHILGIFAVLLGIAPPSARAAQIAVSNYGSSVTGMPWTIALEKGFFKEQNVDITSIISSPGGSGDVRNLIAGSLPYSDSGLISLLGGIKSGADLKIINENGHSTVQFVWIVKPDSPLTSWKDIKGRKITFTTPLSTSQTLDILLVAKAGLKPADVKLVSTGAYGAALTALQNNAVDVALVAEPIYTLNKDKFKVLAWSRDILPAISNTLGIVSTKFASEHPDTLKGILLAHRKAVEFLQTNRKESADIIGRVYKMDPTIVEQVLAQLMDHPTIDGIAFFSLGDIYAKDVDALLAITKDPDDQGPLPDWRKYVDQSFLPPDLRRDLN